MILRRLPWLLCLILVPSALPAQEPKANSDAALIQTASALFKTLQSETLPNGLRVYLLPVPGASTVTVMTAYKVGACDEDKASTGLSHYLEHLLFKGTDKLLPGDVDRATQRNGGRNNAYTSEDMTVYHFDFAADRFGIALEIEADRMRNVRIDEKHEFQQEKGAVIAELKGGEDRPFELEFKAILPLLYSEKAPYSHPVIGKEEHVRGATAEIIKRYYDQWYHPNNASLVIVGGFDPKVTMEKVRTLFGPILKAELPERKPDLPIREQTKQIRKEFTSKFEVPRALIGFNGVKSGDADEYALVLLDSILTGGRTSRLYKKLVEGERMVGDVSGMLSSGRYPGWYGLTLEMLPGKDRAKTEQLLFAELDKLAKEPATEVELKRAKRAVLAAYIFSKEDVHALCDLVAQTVTLHDVDHLKTYLDKLLAVTPEQIQAAAAKYLTQAKSVVVWSLPPDEKKPPTAPAAAPTPLRRKLQRADGDPGAAIPLSLTQAKRTVLPNGLTLITLENKRLPIVTASAFVAQVRLAEPADKNGISAFVGAMLEEGTGIRTGEQIAAAIEDVGGSLSLTANGGNVTVLTPDTDLGLDLFFDSLIEPNFPAEALERVREQILSNIEDAETQPRNRASTAFNALIYGDHPFGRSTYGKKEIIAKLAAADLRSFHAANFVPNRTTIVVVGDIDNAEIAKKIEKLTAGWKRGNAVVPVPTAPPTNDKPTVKILSDANAAQTHVFIGHLGITRNDADYHALLVMDNVLGTGPGFTDRLSASLRDRQGLAYTVNAQIADSAAEQPGTFTGYIGTFPDKFPWVRDGFLKEINRIRDEKATEGEVEDAKKYLLGSLPFRLNTNRSIAGQLLAAERFGLSFDFLENYAKAIKAVTIDDVQRVAKKHLKPDQIIITAVGPIDETGKPLAPAKKDEK